MDGTAKLRVKVGAAEFEGEGPADLIQEQYRAFLAAVSAAPAAATTHTAPVAPVGANTDASGGSAIPPAATTASAPGAFDRALFKRVFTDSNAVISLLALPKGDTSEADALLMLLYAYQELRQNEYPVTGVRLMQSAKQSGLHQVDRIDRKIDTHTQYVLAAGARRGRKYSLNNQGVAKAQELILGLLK